MFSIFKKLFNGNTDRIDALENELKKFRDERTALESELTKLKDDKQQEEDRKNSDVPWVEIRSANFNEEKGIQIELDWNDAFVKYLRGNGIKAATDDLVVQKWLAYLYEDMADRIADEDVKESVSVPQPSEFE